MINTPPVRCNGMKSNVGTLDKVIRILLGLGLFSLIYFLEGNARYWGLFGIMPIMTAFLGWCPAYLPFNLNTHREVC